MDSGIKPAQVFPLFPIPVVSYKLDREFTKQELDFVLNQDTYKNMGNTTSNNTYILDNPVLEDLKKFAASCVENFARNIYLVPNNINFRITQSWLNYSKKGEWHHGHYHPNSFYSGVIYIQAVADKDKIIFDRGTRPTIKINNLQWNHFNSDSWWIPATTGDLILFPSSLDHKVDPVVTEETRISLAFNTFPVGAIGSKHNLTELNLGDS